MPRYADYHRTVIGHHGTRRETALRIVQGEQGFDPSRNDDWLGHGVYFWEYAPQQAWLWARQRQRTQDWDGEIAVVASMIRLGSCFDLLDPENVRELDEIYAVHERLTKVAGVTIPANVRARKRRNCHMFQVAYDLFESMGDPVDSCRAVFVPTRRNKMLWSGSGINPSAHIQICVRNPICILGTWLVKPIEEGYDVDRQ